jgi:hypothetical protein
VAEPAISLFDRLKARGIEMPQMTVNVTVSFQVEDVVRVTYECIAPPEVVEVAIDAIAAASIEKRG